MVLFVNLELAWLALFAWHIKSQSTQPKKLQNLYLSIQPSYVNVPTILKQFKNLQIKNIVQNITLGKN